MIYFNENIPHKKQVIKCSAVEKSFPIEILNCWDLTELEIIGGDFTYFPEDISILKNLKKLTLVTTKVSQLPIDVFQITTLSYLNLKNNRIHSLPILQEKSSLKQLILGRNYLNTKHLEEFLAHFPQLEILDLGHNLIEELPESLFQLKNLKRLNLEGNRLKTLPEKLKDLKELQSLSIDNNSFNQAEKNKIEKTFFKF